MTISKMMIYRDTNLDMRFQATCAACPPYLFTDENAHASKDETITMYPTMTHAMEAGWVATKDRHICKPGQEYAWVCPECAAKMEWVKKWRS
jgi:hypothetical protein